MESSQSQNIELPLLTFNSIYNILREEKRVKTLQKLPSGFYEALEKFIDDKKNEIKKLKDDLNNKEKLMKEKNIYLSTIKIYDELLSLRCSKICNAAIKNSLFEEDIITKENILNKENIFFEDIIKAIKKVKIKIG